MTEQEMLARMVAPGDRRPHKWREGVIQILVTSTCNLSCFNCTQASNVRRDGKPWFMTPDQFEDALQSLGFTQTIDVTTAADGGNRRYQPHPNPDAYFGVVGVFGGNPAVSPYILEYCALLRKYVPFAQRGLWCNDPMSVLIAQEFAATFNPGVSNLNCHMDWGAYDRFKAGWPAAPVFGLDRDSRHSPPWVAMKDVGLDDDAIRELVSRCDINQHWSAMIGVFRGELRAWFCEVAGAQAILHQNDPTYPDTGLDPTLAYVPTDKASVNTNGRAWWQLPMTEFAGQVRKHCWECGVPLKGYGELAQADRSYMASVQDDHPEPKEQVSMTHAGLYRPKRTGRTVQVVTDLVQLEIGRIDRATNYLQNASR